MTLEALATYFAYQTISSDFLILYRHFNTKLASLKCLHHSICAWTIILHVDRYFLVRRTKFSGEICSPGPKFSLAQNFCDRSVILGGHTHLKMEKVVGLVLATKASSGDFLLKFLKANVTLVSSTHIYLSICP